MKLWRPRAGRPTAKLQEKTEEKARLQWEYKKLETNLSAYKQHFEDGDGYEEDELG